MMIALIIIASVIVVFVIPHLIVLFILFNKFYGRVSKETIMKKYLSNPTYKDTKEFTLNSIEEAKKIPHQKVEITSFDNLRLTADYFDNKSKDTIIFFHGAHADPYINFAHLVINMYQEGYNVLLINQRAHGTSEGKYVTYGLKEQEDVLSWIDYVDKNESITNIYLYGISMGGTSLCLSSYKITSKKVKAMVVDCAYSSLNNLLDYILMNNHAPMFLFMGGTKFLAKHLAKVNPSLIVTDEALKKNKIPSLFIHGNRDYVAPIEFLNDNYNNCASYKEKLVIDGAGHTLSTIVGGIEARNKLTHFLKEFSNNE